MSDVKIEGTMSKYDLIWKLACATSSQKEYENKPFLELYALCHTLVDKIDNYKGGLMSQDLNKLIKETLNAP
jgi:hypothetical protein